MEFVLRIIKLINIIFMSLPIYFLWIYRVEPISPLKFYFWGNVAVAGIYAIIYVAYVCFVKKWEPLKMGEVFRGEGAEGG